MVDSVKCRDPKKIAVNLEEKAKINLSVKTFCKKIYNFTPTPKNHIFPKQQ